MNSPNTIHVVFSSTGARTLGRALRQAGRADRVVNFPDGLAIGPIDPPDPRQRVDWLVKTLDFRRRDWGWLPWRVEQFWNRLSDLDAHYVAWTSRRSVYEYTGLLELIWRMDDRMYDVVDLTDATFGRCDKDGKISHRLILSLSMLYPRDIAANALWDRAAALGRAGREFYRKAWAALRRENEAVRIVGPTGLTSAPLSVFDDSLISFATGNWQRAIYLIGHVLAGDDLRYFQVGDHFLAARIAALVQSGKLEHRSPPGDDPPRHGYKFGHSKLKRGDEVRLCGGEATPAGLA